MLIKLKIKYNSGKFIPVAFRSGEFRGTFRYQFRNARIPLEWETIGMAILAEPSANFHSSGMHRNPGGICGALIRPRFFLASRHIRQILTTTLEHCQAFQIRIKVSDFHLFPAWACPGMNSIMTAAQYSSDFLESLLVYNSLASFIALYSGRMADLLAHPHAQAFIGLGGACSWVAQQ